MQIQIPMVKLFVQQVCVCVRCVQCSNFTGMRPVFGDILISFGVVWYSGMRKWYAGFSLVVAAVGVVPGAKPCKSAGITQVYPQNTRYFADFADFATKKALRLALISVRQLVSRTTF